MDRLTASHGVAPSWSAYLDILTIDEDYAREVWEECDAASPEDAWTAAVIEWLDSGLRDWRTRPWAASF
jgi:hypothetical protein